MDFDVKRLTEARLKKLTIRELEYLIKLKDKQRKSFIKRDIKEKSNRFSGRINTLDNQIYRFKQEIKKRQQAVKLSTKKLN